MKHGDISHHIYVLEYKVLYGNAVFEETNTENKKLINNSK
jgi:hypothetical protein